MRSEVLTAEDVNIMVFWDVKKLLPPSSGYKMILKMEAADYSKTFEPIYQTTWHYTPEHHDVNLLISRKSDCWRGSVLKEQKKQCDTCREMTAVAGTVPQTEVKSVE